MLLSQSTAITDVGRVKSYVGAAMTHTLIYPSNSRHNSAGHLEVDGCDVVELAEHYGTPLIVYEEKTIRDQCRRLEQGFSRRTDDYEVMYATKALCTIAICQLVAQEGLSLDVSSGGEYHTALKAGVPTERIFFHGNNKTRTELEYALDNGIGHVVIDLTFIRDRSSGGEYHTALKAGVPTERIFFHGNNKTRTELEYALDNGIGHVVIDSLQELELLEGLAEKRGVIQRVLLRITPGVEAHTHEYIQTGQEDSKFGFGLVEGRAMEAIERGCGAEHLALVGLHAHIGSQIFELEGYRQAIAILVDLIKQAHDQIGFECRYLNAGGGLGIRHTEEDDPPSIDAYAQVKVQGLRGEMERLGLPTPRLLVEPGRSIVGKAGLTAYRVGTIKEVPNIRTFVSVDGGMSDNIRPMLYGAKYEAMLANKAEVRPDTTVTVAGKHCESGDILIKDAEIARPEVGDVLVTPATGGYCYSMASNYNGNPRPCVLLVKDGEAKVMVERETYDDLIAKQRPLSG